MLTVMSHDVLGRSRGDIHADLRPLKSSVAASLDELGLIGGGPDGDVTRVAWSPKVFDAYAWAGERMRALGLTVEIDVGRSARPSD